MQALSAATARRLSVFLAVLFLVPVAVAAETATAETAAAETNGFAAVVEAAHAAATWHTHDAFEAGITVEFGGNTMLTGTMLTTPDGGTIRFELEDGTVLVWDGETAWTAPADSPFQGTRFHVLTWPYFLLAPLKLDDPGARLEDLGTLPLRGGERLPAARLTFGDGVGDTPDDWYVTYRDPESDRLVAMAYIVTFGTPVEKAEEEPHAIVYEGFEEVGGVPVPLRWSFYNWSQEGGIEGDPIGRVVLESPRFVTPKAGAFEAPTGAREDTMPGG